MLEVAGATLRVVSRYSRWLCQQTQSGFLALKENKNTLL